MAANNTTSLAPTLIVTPEALEAVRKIQRAAGTSIGFRPDMSFAASAMLLAAAEMPDIAERISEYGLKLYTAAAQKHAASPAATSVSA